MPNPVPAIQATADLIPVSPLPLQPVTNLAVPALQDTADTIDALVDAMDQPDVKNAEHATQPTSAAEPEHDEVVDDESIGDAYGEDVPQDATVDASRDSHGAEDDDYAKAFDSPPPSTEVKENSPPESAQPQSVDDDPPQPANSDLSHMPSVAAHSILDVHSQPAEASNQPASATASPAAFAQASERQPPPISGMNDVQISDAARPQVPENHTTTPGDIQQLVAELTSQPNVPLPAGSVKPSASTSNSTSSLPPRPPPPSLSKTDTTSHTSSLPDSVPNLGASVPGLPKLYETAGAPGTSTGSARLPPPPTASFAAPANPSAAAASSVPPSAPAGQKSQKKAAAELQRKWDKFISDERKYMAEARWDRFPEGSRIFIGNLSSDRVSKRDVFNMFHSFGRLAQISLKSAYGFVQYHEVEEGKRAVEAMQGAEIKGRRIHLEISRIQDKSKKGRERSPEHGRGGRDGRKNEKKNQGGGRDDYRPGRNQPASGRQDDHYGGENYDRDRPSRDGGRGRNRGRSRSPDYGRNDGDSYRRRSPSPYGGRSRNGSSSHNNNSSSNGELDIPRRYGADVPDVQIILQPDVNREFVAWVEGAFTAKALKTEVMYLHPRFPKEQVIQRQAAEGVHAVVDLDMRAQGRGRIPVQVFDRSGGSHNVRFDQYEDLDPGTASEVILRAKNTNALSNGNGYAQKPAYGNGASYGYPQQQQQPPPQQIASQPQFLAAGYPGVAPPQQAPASMPSAADIASLIGKVDNATLQRLLSTIQAAPPHQPHQPHQPPLPASHLAGLHNVPPPVQPQAIPPPQQQPQLDIQAILSTLNAGNSSTASPISNQNQPNNPAAYGQHKPVAGHNPMQIAPPPPSHASNGGGGDSTAQAQVQNIMAQLARFR